MWARLSGAPQCGGCRNKLSESKQAATTGEKTNLMWEATLELWLFFH
jgi:predicted nucleic-acid-binding Zn-ribbon protein